MNHKVMVALVNALDDDELDRLGRLVSQEYRSRLETKTLPPLCDAELAVIKTNPIAAIKAYKDRTGLTLIESKTACDRARGI